MINRDSKRPVTLEDIIRIKRAERPSAEFWSQFDRELRVKQLAALVEKRPWWRTISFGRMMGGVRRFHVPLGATAVLAATLFSVREFQAPKSSIVAVSSPASTLQAGGFSGSSAASVREVVLEQAEPAPVNITGPALVASQDSALVASPVVLGAELNAASTSGQLVSAVGVAPHAEESTVFVSSHGHGAAEKFTESQVADTRLSRQLLSSARGFETRVLPARSKPVEPLAQMKVPSGSRRSNLIASATLAATTVPVIASERSARALSDDRIYDTSSRVNARGAGVLVKF